MINHVHSDGGRRLLLIEAPEDKAVTLDDAKAALGIADASQDELIEAAIAAASDVLDPAAGGWLGRALRPQKWELQLKCFPARELALPYPPLLSVDSVKYLDANGVDQTLVLGTGYRVIGQGQVYGKAAIAPLYDAAWPAVRVDDASVRIRFSCGYDDDIAVMPKSLKAAIVLGARELMSVSTRDMLLFEDNVEGVGSKRYQSNPLAAEIVKKAIGALLVNLTIS